jgi:hypothetical protein
VFKKHQLSLMVLAHNLVRFSGQQGNDAMKQDGKMSRRQTSHGFTRTGCLTGEPLQRDADAPICSAGELLSNIRVNLRKDSDKRGCASMAEAE